MHLSEGILTLNQALVTSALALPFVYSGFAQHKKSVTSITPEERKPLATMVFALCFAVTLIPIPVPIIGASSHMCATPLLSLLFGPSIIAFPIFGVLLLHALFFAHGGGCHLVWCSWAGGCFPLLRARSRRWRSAAKRRAFPRNLSV